MRPLNDRFSSCSIPEEKYMQVVVIPRALVKERCLWEKKAAGNRDHKRELRSNKEIIIISTRNSC